MWINYEVAISESIEDLIRLERHYRGNPLEDRIRMLRLLKSKYARSQRGLTKTLGYTERQFRRWWKKYRENGMDGLLVRSPVGGTRERITPEVLEDLKSELIRRNGMITLEETRQYLQERWGLKYKSIKGVSALFKRHKIKKKTGRRRHKATNLQVQETFKKKAAYTYYIVRR